LASIVSCPGCRKRMKIGADKPGGKLRCPSCNTAFVLGNQTGNSFGGTPEFQAFELFEAGRETLPPRSTPPFSKQEIPLESNKATLPPREGSLFASEGFGAAGQIGGIITGADRTSESPSDADDSTRETSVDCDVVFLPKDFDPFAVRKTAAATIISTAASLPFLKKSTTEIVSQPFEVILSPVQPLTPEVPVVPMGTNDECAISADELHGFELVEDEPRAVRRESTPGHGRDLGDATNSDIQDRRAILIAGVRIWQLGLILLLLAAGIVFFALATWLVIWLTN
jgi:hypothetical protein